MARRAAIIVGGGSSTRLGEDKLMAEVSGRPLVAHTVSALADHVGLCVLVCREDQMSALASLGLRTQLVPGGSTRTESEIAGLSAIGEGPDLIAIHDGARPLISGSLIEELFGAAERTGGAIPVLPPQAPILHKHGLEPVEAAFVQTPQVFRAGELVAAYEKAAHDGYRGHDTADVVLRYSDLEIESVNGDPNNVKVTFADDLDRVRQLLEDSSRSERE